MKLSKIILHEYVTIFCPTGHVSVYPCENKIDLRYRDKSYFVIHSENVHKLKKKSHPLQRFKFLSHHRRYFCALCCWISDRESSRKCRRHGEYQGEKKRIIPFNIFFSKPLKTNNILHFLPTFYKHLDGT